MRASNSSHGAPPLILAGSKRSPRPHKSHSVSIYKNVHHFFVFKYAIRSSISFVSKPYWKPGIFGEPFRIYVRRVFSSSGVAVAKTPVRSCPIVGGDPMFFSFLTRWQIEQRCKNNPSPLHCCS